MIKYFLFIELVFLFVVMPGVLYLYRLQLKGLVIPLLILVALICLALLLSDRTFSRKLKKPLDPARIHRTRAVVRSASVSCDAGFA